MIKYPKAPIVEAVFDIRIDPSLEVPGKEIESLHTEVSEQYPVKEILRTFAATIEVKEGLPSSQTEDRGIIGARFWDNDKKQVCKFELNGFSFSRLKPYDIEGWEKYFPEVMRLWNIYKKRFAPRNITRVAVRCINSIEIPASRFELSNYFVDAPKPPEGLPQIVTNFLSRLEFQNEDGSLTLITLSLQQPQKSDITPILLDIDVFRNVHFSSGDDVQLRSIFERLRTIKNEIFEASLTDKTKELFR